MKTLKQFLIAGFACAGLALAAGCREAAPPTSAGPTNEKIQIPKGMPGNAAPAPQSPRYR